MAKQSRDHLLQRLSALQSNQDDIPDAAIEKIFCSGGHDSGKHSTDEDLFRMALEIKIYRLKKKLGYAL